MAGMVRVVFLAVSAAVLIGTGAQAQPVHLTEMNFDMWCQEHENLPPERCDKRLPEDDAKFEAYVKKIQDYEVPYLQQRQQKEQLNEVILHNDPVDHPTEPSQPTGPDTPTAPNSEDTPPK